jgi:hypothetical protein
MRIAADTMEPLLMWCLRFIDVFALTSSRPSMNTCGCGRAIRAPETPSAATRATTAPQPKRRHAELAELSGLARLQQAGHALPGRSLSTGERDADWPHLCRLFDVRDNAFDPGRPLRAIVGESGLPVGDDARLDTPITGQLHMRPWRASPVRYTEAPVLARLLSTAARPGTGKAPATTTATRSPKGHNDPTRGPPSGRSPTPSPCWNGYTHTNCCSPPNYYRGGPANPGPRPAPGTGEPRTSRAAISSSSSGASLGHRGPRYRLLRHRRRTRHGPSNAPRDAAAPDHPDDPRIDVLPFGFAFLLPRRAR